jgi:GGDEF domain-containing protein
VAAELATAFLRRLQGALPAPALIGRWSLEEFAAIVRAPRTETTNLAKWIGENLSGTYSCLLSGKTVRPSLQITVAVLEVNGFSPEELMKRVANFLPAGAGS